MKTFSRLILLISSLLLVITFFVPIWHISLDAPQYPEGLAMNIWLTDIRGENEHDLQNINGLNHYIGMKKIIPESIEELKYMPYIIAALSLSGLLAALINKKSFIMGWLIAFCLLGIIGMFDFYLWEYDYGHNLDLEHASIIIPGASFQPPLIGSKQILNFTATSMPALGGWIMITSLLLGIFSLLFDYTKKRKETKVLNFTKTYPDKNEFKETLQSRIMAEVSKNSSSLSFIPNLVKSK
jgi:copper chaperone NosL